MISERTLSKVELQVQNQTHFLRIPIFKLDYSLFGSKVDPLPWFLLLFFFLLAFLHIRLRYNLYILQLWR